MPLQPCPKCLDSKVGRLTIMGKLGERITVRVCRYCDGEQLFAALAARTRGAQQHG